jgi:hypothetical protein
MTCFKVGDRVKMSLKLKRDLCSSRSDLQRKWLSASKDSIGTIVEFSRGKPIVRGLSYLSFCDVMFDPICITLVKSREPQSV